MVEEEVPHVQQHVGQPIVFQRTRFDTQKCEHIVRLVRARHPDLMSIDDPLFADQFRARFQRGEITARTRFGIALRPFEFAADRTRDETLFLPFRPALEQRRHEHHHTGTRHLERRARRRELLCDDQRPQYVRVCSEPPKRFGISLYRYPRSVATRRNSGIRSGSPLRRQLPARKSRISRWNA